MGTPLRVQSTKTRKRPPGNEETDVRDISRSRERLNDYFDNIRVSTNQRAPKMLPRIELSRRESSYIANVTESRLAREQFLLICGGNQSGRRRSRAHDNRSNWTMIVSLSPCFTTVRVAERLSMFVNRGGFIVPFIRVLPENPWRARCHREGSTASVASANCFRA